MNQNNIWDQLDSFRTTEKFLLLVPGKPFEKLVLSTGDAMRRLKPFSDIKEKIDDDTFGKILMYVST